MHRGARGISRTLALSFPRWLRIRLLRDRALTSKVLAAARAGRVRLPSPARARREPRRDDLGLDTESLSYILYDMSDRLNARIDDELARKLTALRRRLGISTTEIVRRSIEQMYRVAFADGGAPAAIMEASGLIGCASGPADLSTRYKSELAQSLRSKA